MNKQILKDLRPDLKIQSKHSEPNKRLKRENDKNRTQIYLNKKMMEEREEVTGFAKDRAVKEDKDDGEKEKKWKLVNRH